MNTIILVYILLKINAFLKINAKLGLMSILLMGVFKNVVPFLVFFFLNVAFFAMISANLGSNYDLASGYSGTPIVLGYFFQTFENGLGNISAPTIAYLSGARNNTFLDKIITCMIYSSWSLAQIVLLIILLNFVIALISQYYEDVMNSAIMHKTKMR